MVERIVTVLDPAETHDLTDLATVKAEFGITDNSQDAKLSSWISQASKVAASYCHRAFGEETVRESLRSHNGWGETVVLSRRPVSSITSVTVDGTACTEDEDYELDAEGGILYGLDINGAHASWVSEISIVVVYAAGYDLPENVPLDLERAVLMMIRDYHSESTSDPNLRRENIPGVMDREWWVSSSEAKTMLPKEVSGLLDPYVNYYIR